MYLAKYGVDLHALLCKSTARRAMNIIDAILCADVIEDAAIDGGVTKVRNKINSIYGKMNTEAFPEYDDAFYERLEKGEVDVSVPSDYVELGDEGLPGIPVMG